MSVVALFFAICIALGILYREGGPGLGHSRGRHDASL